MTAPRGAKGLPGCFSRLPVAVLQLSRDGVVMATNGRLEREIGRELAGLPFADVLDRASSGEKWERLLAAAPHDVGDGELLFELILRGAESIPEPRAFSLLWDPEVERLWMLEHRTDPRMDGLRDQVTGVNSELANTQRELVKERGRLAHTLRELEARTTELQRSNEALDEFAHVVSHDLKAPLRSIANHAAWLEEDVGGTLPEQSVANLRRIRDRAGRMQAMIQGILDYARAGRTRAATEAVDVGRLVDSVVDLLDPPAGLDVTREAEMPTLTTERAPLQQVFLNLIGNAIRYAGPEAPTVRIGTRAAGPFYEFSVADNGPGIPARLQDRVWGLFQTLEPEERSTGTGIGLAVVKKLVESRGGRAWVESEPGAGTTFRFLWPGAAGGERSRDETLNTTSSST